MKGVQMRPVRQSWRLFWFQPATPVNLAVCRGLFYGALFLFYLRTDFSVWADVSPAFWLPISLFRHLHLPLLPKAPLIAIQVVWKSALALSCVGLCTRLSTLTAFALGAYLLALPHNFGHTSHHDAILVFVMGIMALSRCGDGLSVDSLIAARRGKRRSISAVSSGEYTWPVRMVWLVMALIFFAAGVSKLRYSGLGWATAGTMATLLTVSHYHFSNADPLTSWGLPLAHSVWLCRLLAETTLAIEVGFPLALFSSRARSVLVPAGLLMQAGIRVLMGPTFGQFMICYLFWVPWDRLPIPPRRAKGETRSA